MLKNHILSAFGQRQSETITALEVRDHIRQIAETRRETASKALALIREILRHGVTIGLLQYNVARELTAPAVAANPMRHLTTPEDIGDALLACPPSRWCAPICACSPIWYCAPMN